MLQGILTVEISDEYEKYLEYTFDRMVFLFYICTPFNNRARIMAKKGNRIQVILECTEHKNSGVAGTSRYITTKNRKNTPERIELKKYNPILRKYTVHKEIK